MNIMVTGATGFIGQELCRKLVLQHNFVNALVRSEKMDEPQLKYFTGSLTDKASLKKCMLGVDCIVHLAGRAHILKDQADDPIVEFRKVNVEATMVLASVAKELAIKRLVFISSIGVNGSETVMVPFNEKSIPKPNTPYTLSKLEAENGLVELLGMSDTDLVIIRPPMVYGTCAPGNFARLLKIVSLGIPLPFGSVKNKRSLISLSNLVDFIILCTSHPQAAGEIFLVSDGEDLSVSEIIGSLNEGMKGELKIFPFPSILLKFMASCLGKSNVYQQLCCSLVIDSRKARSYLGWTPKLDTASSLRLVGSEYKGK
ncbi:NAD-dependent epimerase/dehydratase family protein [Pseudomonas sp.]|uniref:NAD-dependent epimerase/dehydratase family protein n=1 Tax=Pseudomonas sp. TaxID=306 RepID=UPI003FD7692B